jgi:hypothetical protein
VNAETKVKAATLSGALVRALAEIDGVTKDKVNPHFKSKYADLASALETVRPVFAKFDLAVTQETSPSEDGVIVETVVLHASGDDRRFGKLFVPANKRDAQGFGSALTYAKRYSLLTALGIPTEDDDGNAAARSAPQRATTNGNAQPITDEQRSLMTSLIPAAGKTVQDIVEAYGVSSIAELTQSKAAAAIARLQSLAKEPA